MARQPKAQKQKPPPFPPTVKGWWAKMSAEQGVEYILLQRDRSDSLRPWDLMKLSAVEEPKSGDWVYWSHVNWSLCFVGLLKINRDQTAELTLAFGSGRTLVFAKNECNKMKISKIVGLVKLPNLDSRAFLERSFLENPDDPCGDPTGQEDDAFFQKYQKHG